MLINKYNRALSSMIEAASIVSSSRSMVLVIKDIEDGSNLDGSIVSGRELKDLNRARAYLRDIACRHGIRIFDDISIGIEHVINIINNNL